MRAVFRTLMALVPAMCSFDLSGAIVTETGDAGETIATAQLLLGSGELSGIRGSLSNLGTEADPVDDVDLFGFRIVSPDQFSATVSADLSADNDIQIFLFDSSAMLALFSDDDSSVFPPSLLPRIRPGDAAHLPAGSYFLGISLFDTLPTNPLTGWSRDPFPFQFGSYEILLAGADYAETNVIPEPSTAVLIGGALVGITALRLRRSH